MKTKEFDNKIECTTDNQSEAKIIDLKDYVEYDKKLSEIMETAGDLAEDIYDSLFELACLDKWKNWSDSQPVGTVFDVDEEMLRNTGDKNIDCLWELLDKLVEVKEKIKVRK